MWVSCYTSAQTGWPAGSPSHPSYLRIIRLGKGSDFTITHKSAVFSGKPGAGELMLLSLVVLSKWKRLPVVWFHFLSLFQNTYSLVFSEIEAKEACDWLRAAGFPQYAQLFEGNKGTQWTPTHIHHKEGKCCLVKRWRRMNERTLWWTKKKEAFFVTANFISVMEWNAEL